VPGIGGARAGFDAVVAASSSGLTPDAWCVGAICGCGVLAPVPAGVLMFDGSSDVNIVALDGEIRYLLFSVARRASLKPVIVS
jgi:hypothetical protein